MDKLTLAHEMAIAMQSKEPIVDMKVLAALCFQYAEAMLAEQEKRSTAVIDEFKVDWSQAPEWATHWAVDKNMKAHWYKGIPETDGREWVMAMTCSYYIQSPSFNYKGDWKDSLRERP